MVWFCNHYECYQCGVAWTDEWSCMCDDQCPGCGARDNSPIESIDLTGIIVAAGSEFAVFRSPDAAEDDPAYIEVARFPTPELAEAFLANEPQYSGQ